MEEENKQQHEGLTIIIRRELHEYERAELKELIETYELKDGSTTIGFF